MKTLFGGGIIGFVLGWAVTASGGSPFGPLQYNAYTTQTTAHVDARVTALMSPSTNAIPEGVLTNNQSGVTLRGMTNRNGLTVVGAQIVTGTLSASSVTATNGVVDKANVKFYGATGDGSHDDATALASAIAGATTYGVVTLPAGTYRVTSTVSLDGVREIRGAGQFQTIIKAATPGMDVLHIGNSAAAGRVMVSDLCIDGNGLAQNGIVVANTNGAIYGLGGIQDCLVQNCRGDGIQIRRTISFSVNRVISRYNMNGVAAYLIGGVEPTTAYFSACDFSSNTNNGVYLGYGRNFVFQNCIMENNGGPGFTGLACELLKLDSCWFEFNNNVTTYSNIAHVMFLPGVNYPTRVNITGCQFAVAENTNQCAIYFGEGDYTVIDNYFYRFPTEGTLACSNSILVNITGHSSYDSTYPYFGPGWLFTNAVPTLGPLPNISWHYSGRNGVSDTSTLTDSLWVNGGLGGLLLAYGTYASTNGASPETRFPPSSVSIPAPLALTNTSPGYTSTTTNNALELFNKGSLGDFNAGIGIQFGGDLGPMARLLAANNPFRSYGGFFELYTYDNIIQGKSNLVLHAAHQGNLGVGTNDPGYRLDVAGPVNATAYFENGVPFTGAADVVTTNVNTFTRSNIFQDTIYAQNGIVVLSTNATATNTFEGYTIIQDGLFSGDGSGLTNVSGANIAKAGIDAAHTGVVYVDNSTIGVDSNGKIFAVFESGGAVQGSNVLGTVSSATNAMYVDGVLTNSISGTADNVAAGVTNAWQVYARGTTNATSFTAMGFALLTDATNAATASTNGLGTAAFKAINFFDAAGAGTTAAANATNAIPLITVVTNNLPATLTNNISGTAAMATKPASNGNNAASSVALDASGNFTGNAVGPVVTNLLSGTSALNAKQLTGVLNPSAVPVAGTTAGALGGVYVDNSTILVGPDGVISAVSGGGGAATNAVSRIYAQGALTSAGPTNLYVWVGSNLTLNYTNGTPTQAVHLAFSIPFQPATNGGPVAGSQVTGASTITNGMASQAYADSKTNGYAWTNLAANTVVAGVSNQWRVDATNAATAATNGLGTAAFKATSYFDLAGAATAVTSAVPLITVVSNNLPATLTNNISGTAASVSGGSVSATTGKFSGVTSNLNTSYFGSAGQAYFDTSGNLYIPSFSTPTQYAGTIILTNAPQLNLGLSTNYGGTLSNAQIVAALGYTPPTNTYAGLTNALGFVPATNGVGGSGGAITFTNDVNANGYGLTNLNKVLVGSPPSTAFSNYFGGTTLITNLTADLSRSSNYLGTTGDVIVVHTNGSITAYTASANTDAARGNALNQAVTNCISGDIVRLQPTSYSLTNFLRLDVTNAPGISIVGSGKYLTRILEGRDYTTMGGHFIRMGNGSVVSDLCITSTVTGGDYSMLIGHSTDVSFTNGVIRNVFLAGGSDCVYFNSANSSCEIRDCDLISAYDCFNIAGSGSVYSIYNCRSTSVASSDFPLHVNGFTCGQATVNTYNCVVSGSGGSADNAGYSVGSGTINIYGGKASSSGTAAYDIINTGSATINVAPGTIYSTTSGTVNLLPVLTVSAGITNAWQTYAQSVTNGYPWTNIAASAVSSSVTNGLTTAFAGNGSPAGVVTPIAAAAFYTQKDSSPPGIIWAWYDGSWH